MQELPFHKLGVSSFSYDESHLNEAEGRANSEPCQTYKIERFGKIFNG